jgi:hypothetical protein
MSLISKLPNDLLAFTKVASKYLIHLVNLMVASNISSYTRGGQLFSFAGHDTALYVPRGPHLPWFAIKPMKIVKSSFYCNIVYKKMCVTRALNKKG